MERNCNQEAQRKKNTDEDNNEDRECPSKNQRTENPEQNEEVVMVDNPNSPAQMSPSKTTQATQVVTNSDQMNATKRQSHLTTLLNRNKASSKWPKHYS